MMDFVAIVLLQHAQLYLHVIMMLMQHVMTEVVMMSLDVQRLASNYNSLATCDNGS